MILHSSSLKALKTPVQIAIPCLLIAVITQYLVLPHTNAEQGYANYELARIADETRLYIRVPTLVTEQTEFTAQFYFVRSVTMPMNSLLSLQVTGDRIEPFFIQWTGIEDTSTIRFTAEHAGTLPFLLEGSIAFPDPYGIFGKLHAGRQFTPYAQQKIKQTITVSVAASTRHRVQFGIYVFVPLYLGVLGITWLVSSIRQERKKQADKVKEAESNIKEEPTKAIYAWDLARINLELYFGRNRTQVSQVFLIAIIVMSIGFVLISVGVVLAMHNPKEIAPPLVAGISGIITQFIGATFMVIYRSTMTQANEFMVILERINTVGMAIQVLDSIPESETALKSESRAKIVELLLSSRISTSTAKAKKSKAASA